MTARYGDDPRRSPMTEAIEDCLSDELGCPVVALELRHEEVWAVGSIYHMRAFKIVRSGWFWAVYDGNVCRIRRATGLFEVARCIRAAVEAG